MCSVGNDVVICCTNDTEFELISQAELQRIQRMGLGIWSLDTTVHIAQTPFTM